MAYGEDAEAAASGDVVIIIPNSFGLRLREFNPNHYPAGPRGGQFAPAKGGGQTPISNVDEAITRILRGEDVELSSVHKVYTVLSKLGTMALEAKKLGEKAPTYDLCKVSVAGTNLFCGARLTTKEYPHGIPRLRMPQLSGAPRPNSMAAALPANKHGRVDGGPAFLSFLRRRGIAFKEEEIPSGQLRASQSELKGPTVAMMMRNPTKLYGKGPVFISRDSYIVDGHHRWAAQVGLDARDGKLGRAIRVVRVDAPISAVLRLARGWSARFGIEPVGVN